VGVVSRYTLKDDPYSSHSVILDWLGEGRGRRLLDVGAADGLLARLLTARGWKVTGLEADPAAAAAGASHCERMIVADLDGGVPTLEGEFDAIVCADVLEHLRNPAATLASLRHALATTGEVVISIPNVAHLWVRLSLLLGRFEYAERGILDRTHLRFFTRRSLAALVREAGLRITRATSTPVPLYQVVPEPWHGRALAAAHALSARSARLLPRLLAYQFVVGATHA
jgi:2-polyprenyl-3-methyl-5-hydroxy-6-metoxy-1,4-benzoquinol methylase